MVWTYDPFIFDPTDFTDLLAFPDPIPGFNLPAQDDGDKEDEQPALPEQPGTQFARDTWWDALLSFYAAADDTPDSMCIVSLTQVQRNSAMKSIVNDLRALLQGAPSFLSFLHIPRFFDTLFSPIRRNSMQPSLLMSALALGVLAQSSEAEKGHKGRKRALKLLDMAHSALEGSLATGWVDIGLAQAALVRSLCAHLVRRPHADLADSS